jgi:hypothetical protein
VCQADAAEGSALIAGVDLHLQQLSQEVSVAVLGFGGILGHGRKDLFLLVPCEAMQVVVQALLVGRHADTFSPMAAACRLVPGALEASVAPCPEG